MQKLSVVLIFALALAFSALAAPSIDSEDDLKCIFADCGTGCCQFPNFVCCENGFECAFSYQDCTETRRSIVPLVPYPKQRVAPLVSSKDDCSGVLCLHGCCPFLGFFCCPNADKCAFTPDDC